MTFSPLCARSVPTKNYSSRQGNKVRRLIIHYTAGGTDESNVRLLSRSQDYGRQASCTYVLQRNGALVGIVPEEYRPWTSGSFSADATAVTVETVIAPKGQATAAQMETLAKLAADLSNRYGWGPLNRTNVRGHREFAATDCPGPYLWPRMNQIVERANQIRGGATPTPQPTPAPAGDIDALADAVIRGEYGNGDERRSRLGDKYDAVQRRVNEKLSGKQPAKPAPKPTPKPAANIDALADAVIRGEYGNGEERKRRLGSNYAAVQARVNEKLAGKSPKPSVDIDALADAVIRGEYGNGDERKRRLGANYAAVQARVNEKLGY